MNDQPTITASVSDSALLALYLMEMADTGATISLMIHGVDTDTRERILSRFTERGWERNDIPNNNDQRGVRTPFGERSIDLWP
jgi:hypothetical protein